MATGQAAGMLAAFRMDEDARQADFAAVRCICERNGVITMSKTVAAREDHGVFADVG